MPAILQMLALLVQILPSALKVLATWQEYHGQKLNGENRARLAGDIKDAVNSKDATVIENMIKNLGKPPTRAA